MTKEMIKEKSGCSLEVAESIYYHCIWIRTAKDDTKINWRALFNDVNYRRFGE